MKYIIHFNKDHFTLKGELAAVRKKSVNQNQIKSHICIFSWVKWKATNALFMTMKSMMRL
jgi:hypothetical protein